jgi:hypothetical protein
MKDMEDLKDLKDLKLLNDSSQSIIKIPVTVREHKGIVMPPL